MTDRPARPRRDPRRAAGRRRGDAAADPRAACRGRAVGLGPHRHPRPVAAAHLAPSQAPGRGRPRRAPPRGRLGLLPPRRPRRRRRHPARRCSTRSTAPIAQLADDRARLAAVRAQRAQAAQAFFARLAPEWDRIRSLHVPEAAVEAAILEALGDEAGPQPPRSRHRHRPHAAAARAARRPRRRARCQPRHAVGRPRQPREGGPQPRRAAPGRHLRAAVRRAAPSTSWSIHQVLHYLDDPARALREAARLVAPGGRLLVVDFAPHGLEFLRESQAHRRLGFAREQVAGWLAEAGLDCTLTPRSRAAEAAATDQLTVSLWLGQDRRVVTDWPLAASEPRGRLMQPAAFRPSRHGARPIRVSFEFFPPKTAEMEATLWASIERLAPLQPALRLRDLRRRRLDPRAHPQHRRADRARDAAEARRPSHLRRRDEAPRSTRWCAPTGTPACATSWRCAATRPAASARAYEPHPGGYGQTCDLVAGIKRVGDFEVSVSAYPGEAPGGGLARRRHRRAEGARSIAAPTAPSPSSSSTTTSISATSTACGRAASTIPIVPGILPVQNFKQAANFAARAGASVPDWLAARFEGLDEDVDTRKLIAAAVAAEQVHRPRRPRRDRVPLLHHEPRRPRLRDLPPAGPAGAAGGGSGRRPSGHPGRATLRPEAGTRTTRESPLERDRHDG